MWRRLLRLLFCPGLASMLQLVLPPSFATAHSFPCFVLACLYTPFSSCALHTSYCQTSSSFCLFHAVTSVILASISPCLICRLLMRFGQTSPPDWQFCSQTCVKCILLFFVSGLKTCHIKGRLNKGGLNPRVDYYNEYGPFIQEPEIPFSPPVPLLCTSHLSVPVSQQHLNQYHNHHHNRSLKCYIPDWSPRLQRWAASHVQVSVWPPGSMGDCAGDPGHCGLPAKYRAPLNPADLVPVCLHLIPP